MSDNMIKNIADAGVGAGIAGAALIGFLPILAPAAGIFSILALVGGTVYLLRGVQNAAKVKLVPL